MLHNTDISCLMSIIVGNIMPLCAKEANPELWFIYNEMQKWEMLVERKIPLLDKDEPAQTAKTIRLHLDKLTDRKLAGAIEQILVRYTPHDSDPAN